MKESRIRPTLGQITPNETVCFECERRGSSGRYHKATLIERGRADQCLVGTALAGLLAPPNLRDLNSNPIFSPSNARHTLGSVRSLEFGD